jgi:crotonobetainyl-CoA:carnitine CoA-transferase CaiB-like acyl-CoA transferase
MRPLSHIRVLDLSRLLPGPFATGVLADMGALVDKIEDTQGGDYLRHMPPQIGEDNAAFATLNRGKRSAILDLKNPAARDALLTILPRYDVLFEQFRPGVLARLGLAPEMLRERFPKLVLCSLTGYGQTGPLALRAGHDLNYIARSGALGATGPEGGVPQAPGFQLADISGGLWSIVAILGALIHRDRTGEGAHLDIAMSEGTLPFAVMSLAPALSGAPGTPGGEQLTGGIAPYNTYRTKDGRAVAVAALEPKFWMKLAGLLGIEASLGDLLAGPHQAALKERLASTFAERTLAEWVAWSADKDCLVEPILTASELRADAHLTARGMFFDHETPSGKVPHVRTPVTPRDVSGAVAKAGADTRAILAEGGVAPEVIEALYASGAAKG